MRRVHGETNGPAEHEKASRMTGLAMRAYQNAVSIQAIQQHPISQRCPFLFVPSVVSVVSYLWSLSRSSNGGKRKGASTGWDGKTTAQKGMRFTGEEREFLVGWSFGTKARQGPIHSPLIGTVGQLERRQGPWKSWGRRTLVLPVVLVRLVLVLCLARFGTWGLGRTQHQILPKFGRLVPVRTTHAAC